MKVMKLTSKTVRAWCEKYQWDYANEYGEPGYSLAEGKVCILFGDWNFSWSPDTLRSKKGRVYPRIVDQLGEQYELEWEDEWTIDWENGARAYRTQPDSYSWTPSYIYTEYGDMLTPDDDLEAWVEYVKNDPSKCLVGPYGARELLAAGWTQWPDDAAHQYESGWHPGMDDDPKAVYAEIQQYLEDAKADGKIHPDMEFDVVFALSEQSQFYTGFKAFYKMQDPQEWSE